VSKVESAYGFRTGDFITVRKGRERDVRYYGTQEPVPAGRLLQVVAVAPKVRKSGNGCGCLKGCRRDMFLACRDMKDGPVGRTAVCTCAAVKARPVRGAANGGSENGR
jgi:hypothetical protein